MAGIIIGVALLAIAGGLYYFANRSKRRGAGLAAAPTVPVKDLGSVGGAVVEVVGTATASGPELLSPIGQRPCVWFRATVHEIYRERDRDPQGNMRTRTRERLVSDDTSTNAIAIDDSTGVVLVDAADLDIDQPVLAVDRRIADDDSFAEELLKSFVRGDDSDGFRQRERIIPTGQRVFAIGAATVGPDGPRLSKPADKAQPFMLSTRDEAALQKSAASSARWLTVGAVVAAVVGAVAVVLGALA